MELTFVPQYSGDALKRKRLAKACEKCRSRKKRCRHMEEDDGDEDAARPKRRTTTGNEPTSQPHEVARDDSHERITPPAPSGQLKALSRSAGEPHAKTQRFIGDLNPEARFLERSDAPANRSTGMPKGIWIDRSEWDALMRERNVGVPRDGVVGALEDPKATGSQYPRLLNSVDEAALIDVFFRRVHPVLPLLQEDEFRRSCAERTVPVALVHAVCLVAGKDSSAESLLRFSGSTTTVAPREFARTLYLSALQALNPASVPDKMTRIRTLALLSLHLEGTDGCEDASLHLAQAMHYSQTMGLHLGHYGTRTHADGVPMKRLFWVLWTLDRLHAATSGRPVVMYERDVAISTLAPGESGFPAFDVWLRIAEMLDKTIDYYRPGCPASATGWETDFPGFEELVDQANAWHLSAPTLSTLHIYYLSVAMISSRRRNVNNTPINSPSYERQNLSTMELIRLIEYGPGLENLLPIPVICYGISLALSVSYQHVRQDKLPHRKAGARRDFETCARYLQTLRRTWANADLTATLARKVLAELEKNPRLLSQPPQTDRQFAFTLNCVETGEPHEVPVEGPQTVEGATPQVDSAMNSGSAQASGEFDINWDWFTGMDDIFGTYLDPNNPINHDGLSFLDDFNADGWQP
ncbi:hypothetical protein MBLNU230_g6450t1 [Neophaeotheca triangularis]